MLCTGFLHPAIFTMGAVYGALMNFSILEISLYLSLITISGAVFQWPIGYISDNFDRRKIIIACAFFAIIFSILAILSSGLSLNNLFLENFNEREFKSINKKYLEPINLIIKQLCSKGIYAHVV